MEPSLSHRVDNDLPTGYLPRDITRPRAEENQSTVSSEPDTEERGKGQTSIISENIITFP